MPGAPSVQPVVTTQPITSTTTTQINNGFNGTGTPTEPIIANTTIIPTAPVAPVQNLAVVTPSPAPVQQTNTTQPWWMAFMSYTPMPVVNTYTPPPIQQTVQMPTPVSTVGSTVTAPPTPPNTQFDFGTGLNGDTSNPEPGTWLLLAGGLGGVIAYRRRKRA